MSVDLILPVNTVVSYNFVLTEHLVNYFIQQFWSKINIWSILKLNIFQKLSYFFMSIWLSCNKK